MSAPMLHLQIKHFRLVQAIAATGQLTLAADRLAITQPAASRSLSEIERLMGGPVFDRHPKGMTPTLLGEVLVRRGAQLLGYLDETAQELTAVRSGMAGAVRVGAVTGAAIGYIVPAVQALKEETKNVDIQVTVAPSAELMDDLLSGELDFILSRVPPGVDARQLDILQGRAEAVRLLVRSTHPLLDRRNLDLRALNDFPWLIQQRGMPIRQAVDAAHIAAGVPTPADVIDSASLVMTIAYLRSSDAISPVAHEVAHMLSENGAIGFATLNMAEEIIIQPYHLLRHRYRPLSPLAGRFLNMVKQGLAV